MQFGIVIPFILGIVNSTQIQPVSKMQSSLMLKRVVFLVTTWP
jgi:hypothetical protein